MFYFIHFVNQPYEDETLNTAEMLSFFTLSMMAFSANYFASGIQTTNIIELISFIEKQLLWIKVLYISACYGFNLIFFAYVIMLFLKSYSTRAQKIIQAIKDFLLKTYQSFISRVKFFCYPCLLKSKKQKSRRDRVTFQASNVRDLQLETTDALNQNPTQITLQQIIEESQLEPVPREGHIKRPLTQFITISPPGNPQMQPRKLRSHSQSPRRKMPRLSRQTRSHSTEKIKQEVIKKSGVITGALFAVQEVNESLDGSKIQHKVLHRGGNYSTCQEKSKREEFQLEPEKI